MTNRGLSSESRSLYIPFKENGIIRNSLSLNQSIMPNKTNYNNIKDKTEEKQTQESEQYWKNIEAFINQANDISSTQGLDNTSSSFLYAAARFSAFNAVSKYKNVESMARDKAEAVKYFTATFNKMFQQNMDDYENNFNQYFKSGNENK